MIGLGQLTNYNTQTQRHLMGISSCISYLSAIFFVFTIAFVALFPAKSTLAESTTIEESKDIQISVILEKVSGDDQTGLTGKSLKKAFKVKLLWEGTDIGVEDAEVTFEIISQPEGANASLSITKTTTNEEGEAETTLTLDDKSGTYTVTASSLGVSSGSPQEFKAMGLNLDELMDTFNKKAKLIEEKINEFNERVEEYNSSLADFAYHPTEEKMDITLDKYKALCRIKDELISLLQSFQSQAEKIDEVADTLNSEGFEIALYLGGPLGETLGYTKYTEGVAVAALSSLATPQEVAKAKKKSWLSTTFTFVTGVAGWVSRPVATVISVLGTVADQKKRGNELKTSLKNTRTEIAGVLFEEVSNGAALYNEEANKNPNDNVHPIGGRTKYSEWTRDEEIVMCDLITTYHPEDGGRILAMEQKWKTEIFENLQAKPIE